MLIKTGPISYTAYKAWQRNVNQYLLYRLGYLSRAPYLHRGINVHEAIQHAAMGRAPWPEELEGLARWLGRYDICGVETRMVSENGLVHGRADLLLLVDGELVIADIKTGRPYSDHHLQMHWYATCFQQLSPSRGVLIYLSSAVPTPDWVFSKPSDVADVVERARQAHFEISHQHIPETMVIPVHGTTFVDSSVLSKLKEGSTVLIEQEAVDTEEGPGWGLRVKLPDDTPVGWIPDSLKERISAHKASVFACRPTTSQRNGYVRLKIPSAEIDWSGIASNGR